MLFSGLKSEEGQSLTSAETKLQIANSFKSISDYVQIQLTKTPNKVIKDIINRKKADGESNSQIKTYLDGVITQAMSTTSQIRTQSLSEIDEELRSGIIDKDRYFDKYRTQVQRDTQEYQNEIIEERNKYLQMIENNLK
jgi:two-component sensor histidine kinase